MSISRGYDVGVIDRLAADLTQKLFVNAEGHWCAAVHRWSLVLATPQEGEAKMNDETARAVRTLVNALMAHPKDLQMMKVYGNLPDHLLDLVSDYDDDLSNMEVN